MLWNCSVGEDSWDSWTIRGSNQLMLKEINLKYSSERLMLKLKLQYFSHLIWRTDSLEKTLMLGKAGGEGDDRGQDGWMASLIQWTWVWASSVGWWRIGKPGMLQSMGLQRVVHDWASEQPPPVILHSETLGNFTTLIFLIYSGIMFKNSSIPIVLN